MIITVFAYCHYVLDAEMKVEEISGEPAGTYDALANATTCCNAQGN